MKVLLVGDFSGLHAHLAAGLRESGCSVTVTSSGDAFKKIKADRVLHSGRPGLAGMASRMFKPLLDLPEYRGHDVVQFISPDVLGKTAWHSVMANFLRKCGDKSFVLGCGDDALTYHGLLAGDIRYSWLRPMLNDRGPGEDLAVVVHDLLSTPAWARCTREVEKFDGAIPMAYEYSLGYGGLRNSMKTLPFPYSLGEDAPPFVDDGPLVFFHGVNRESFKGTPHIRKAFAILEEMAPGKVKTIIADRMPLDEYKNALSSAHVVVDQCNSYSYAMNALLALSMNKVVMSGAEPETLSAWGIPLNECPVVNILPDVEQMAQEMFKLVMNRKETRDRANAAREYVRTYHDSGRVAEAFIREWKECRS